MVKPDVQFREGPGIGEKERRQRLHALDMSKFKCKNLMPLFQNDLRSPGAGTTTMNPPCFGGMISVVYTPDKFD